jgi:hypothetical protein
VYAVYRRWPKALKKARAEQMAKFAEIRCRRSSHPIRVIIDCSSPSTDAKTKSKWTRALRYATLQNVMSENLCEFLMEKGKGGLAGRATAFTNLAAATKAKLRSR